MISENVIIEKTSVCVKVFDRNIDPLQQFGAFWDDLSVSYIMMTTWSHYGLEYVDFLPCRTWLDVQRQKLELPAKIQATREKAKEQIRRELCPMV